MFMCKTGDMRTGTNVLHYTIMKINEWEIVKLYIMPHHIFIHTILLKCIYLAMIRVHV